MVPIGIPRPDKAARALVAALALAAAPLALLPTSAQERAPGHVAVPDVTRAPWDGAPPFEGGRAPLEEMPLRLANFETAGVLPAGTLALSVGSVQTDPTASAGTGNQLYFGRLRWGATDRLSVGLDYQTYEDPTLQPILGMMPDVDLDNVAVHAKYSAFDLGGLSVAAMGSVEFFRFRVDLAGAPQEGKVIGSVELPMSYALSPRLAFHLTPAVTFLPDTISGTDSFGTVASLGAGASIRTSRRLVLYGTLEMPFGAAGNTITGDATFDNVAVWTTGARWNLTPRAALDLYVTNGVGTTPATSVLTHWPDGDATLVGVELTYTPGVELAESYRGRPAPVTARDLALQEDGFTLDAAPTREPGAVALGAWYGTDENHGALVSFSPDRDLQFDFVLEALANDGSVPATLFPSDGTRYLVGPKLRFLDQANGDAVTLSARGLFGRSFNQSTAGPGVFYAGLTAAYAFGDMLTVSASPRLAAFGETEIFGLGLGANLDVGRGLAVIAEVTPVAGDGRDATWAAGLRYDLPRAGVMLDLNASNAAGRYGIGGLLAQDSVRYTLGVSKGFSLR